MNTDTNLLWRAAMHEAGHAIICIHLGGEVSSISVNAGGGECILADALSRDSSVFFTAAGPGAEHLADLHPAPESLPRAESTAETSPSGSGHNNANHFPPREFAATLSDSQRIASWIVGGFEDQPERWLIRYKFVHRIAEQLVEDHATEIVQVASELFRRGSLSGGDIQFILHRKNSEVA